MSSTIGTIAGTTGLGSARQVVYGANSQLYWAFQFTGTLTLSSWSSPDNATWTSRASHTLPIAHGSEGRDLMVTCRTINNIDTIHLCYIGTPTVTHTVKALRATVAGTTITYHTLDTTISDATATGTLAAPSYSSGGWEFNSGNLVECVNGALDINQDISFTKSSADPGTGEQATPPTWSVVQGLDSSMAKEVKSGFLADMGATNMLRLNDDGSGDSTCTGFNSGKYDGSTWTGITAPATGLSAIGKNDWGAVTRVSGSDVHMVYRSSTGSLIHKRYNGTAWGAGQTIPAQNNLADGGIALTTDGASVWLGVIDTDAANTVRYIQWTSNAYTGAGDAWATSWSAVETSSATRTFLGACKDVQNQLALFYWTEGTSMVAATAAAPNPPDPPGLAFRDCVSPLGSGASSTTLAIPFSGACQPTKGGKVVVGFWSSFASTPTITSVLDNATSQNTYSVASGATSVGGTQGCWIYWLDLPSSASWSGNYTITVTFSTSQTESDGGAISFSNMQLGAPTNTNANTSSGAAATPGSVNPALTPATYFSVVTDATGANPAAFTWPAPFLKEITQTNGATQQAGSIGDALNSSGAQNPSVTIDNALWNAAIAVWPGAPSGPLAGNFLPRLVRGTPSMLRRERAFMSPQRYAYPVAAAPAVAAAPLIAMTALKRVVSTPRSRAVRAPVAAIAAPPTRRVERLVSITSTPRGRVRLATPAAPATPASSGRTVLKRVLATPRGLARVAGAGPLGSAPTRIRERLVASLPPLKGRARIAGESIAAAPTRPRTGRLIPTVPTPRGRATTIVVILGKAPVVARTALKRVVPVLPGGKGRVAKAGPLAARPLTARSLLKFPIRLIRGALARLGAIPQITSVTVFDYLYDAQGLPLRDRQVVAQLTTPSQNRQVVLTDGNGYWQFSLLPAKTYMISIAGLQGYRITTPSGAGPFQSSQVLA